MGYLNNQTIIVDAILTNKGREILASGVENFRISYFALADDEVDYRLWNPAHALGSNYYGEVIENMPILEASPNETEMLKYKLTSYPQNTSVLPVIQVSNTSIVLYTLSSVGAIEPTTTPIGGNDQGGYTIILNDNTYCDIRVAPAGGITDVNDILNVAAGTGTVSRDVNPVTFSTDSTSRTPVYTSNTVGVSRTLVGKKFEVFPKQTMVDRNATITITGNETGGSIAINILIKANIPLPGGQSTYDIGELQSR